MLEQLLDLLGFIAKSDGKITPAELEYLANVSDIFGFDEADFIDFKAFTKLVLLSPFEVLGVSVEKINDNELKIAWKNLARKHHPDTLTASGMPEEFVSAVNERLAKINAAYDFIVRRRRQQNITR